MSSSIELYYLAAIVDTGDLSSIHEGIVTEQDMLTGESQHLFNFITQYRYITGGRGRVPSREIIEERFGDSIVLPRLSGIDPDDIDALAHEVHLNRVRAELRQLSTDILTLADMTDPLSHVGELRKRFESTVDRVGPRNEDIALSETIGSIIEDYRAGNILPEGIPWPWPSLQNPTKGMHREEFYVIAGRPKTRKSFIANYIAVNSYLQHGCRVLAFTPEMPQRQWMLRTVATLARIAYGDFKTGLLTEEEELRLFETGTRYGASQALETAEAIYGTDSEEDVELGVPGTGKREPNFVTIKSSGRSIGFFESKIEQYAPDLILVDSFYRHQAPGVKASDSEHRQTTQVARALKNLAMEASVPILATHQLNRDAEQRLLASLSNLALSDAVGQELDLGMQAITLPRKAGDITALSMIGARETNFEGLLINNIPCNNFEEIEAIESKKKMRRLIEEYLEADDLDSDDSQKKKPQQTRPQPTNHGPAFLGSGKMQSKARKNLETVANRHNQ